MDKLYETCVALRITLFTIAHEVAARKHHQKVLTFNGRGGWELAANEGQW